MKRGIECGGDSDPKTVMNVFSTARLWQEAAAILSGAIGGGWYGLKVRLPHALVMTFLFRRNLPIQQKTKIIAKLAIEHASNLASFAFLYKALLAILKAMSRKLDQNYRSKDTSSLNRLGVSVLSCLIDGTYLRQKQSACSSVSIAPGLPERPYHAFLSGAVGGYIVWGKYSGVNYQLLLYLGSRIIVGCIKLANKKRIPPFSWKSLTFQKMYPLAAAGIWGTVMMLFEEYPDVLHPTLKQSMDDIYRYRSRIELK